MKVLRDITFLAAGPQVNAVVSGFGDRMDEHPNAICCFCGEYAPIGSHDFFELIVNLPDGAGQHLWAHGECLRRAVHPSVPMLPPEDE